MVAQMNACTLSGVIAVDVEDFGVAWCNAPERLFVDDAHGSLPLICCIHMRSFCITRGYLSCKKVIKYDII